MAPPFDARACGAAVSYEDLACHLAPVSLDDRSRTRL